MGLAILIALNAWVVCCLLLEVWRAWGLQLFWLGRQAELRLRVKGFRVGM